MVVLGTLAACTSSSTDQESGDGSASASGADAEPSVGATSETAPGVPDAPSQVAAAAVPVSTTVTTLAGSGVAAFADGTGRAASFFHPSGVALDAVGNVYVADKYNHRIRKITAAGEVTTLAGSGTAGSADGTGTDASFDFPSGVAVDADGNVLVADKFSYRIRKVTPAGVVSTVAGSGVAGVIDGTGTAASFTTPLGIAVGSAGSIFVTDNGVTGVDNNRIRKITSAGLVTTLAGSDQAAFADGTGSAASFDYPVGVAVDAADTVYVADSNNHRIRKIDSAGSVTTLAGSGTAAFADGAGITASFSHPMGVAVDPAGNVYVADFYNHRIRSVTAGGVVSTLAGSDTGGFADGTGAAATFDYPFGIAVDAAGKLYVADYENHGIRTVAVVGLGELTVSWSPSPPATAAVTGYTASASAVGHATRTCTTTGPITCIIRGLASGVAYAVTVTAVSAAGTSAPSLAAVATPS